jgi:hypothetical protein
MFTFILLFLICLAMGLMAYDYLETEFGAVSDKIMLVRATHFILWLIIDACTYGTEAFILSCLMTLFDGFVLSQRFKR